MYVKIKVLTTSKIYLTTIPTPMVAAAVLFKAMIFVIKLEDTVFIFLFGEVYRRTLAFM